MMDSCVLVQLLLLLLMRENSFLLVHQWRVFRY